MTIRHNDPTPTTDDLVKNLIRIGMLNSNGALRRFQGQVALTKSADVTLASTDSGYVIFVDTDAFTITLPATAAGFTYTIVNAGVSGVDATAIITISPNASDKIQGMGLTAADNKDLINTKATAKVGDFVTLVGDGSDGWLIQAVKGIWAREA